jgi:hypothetical protein
MGLRGAGAGAPASAYARGFLHNTHLMNAMYVFLIGVELI